MSFNPEAGGWWRPENGDPLATLATRDVSI